MAIRTAGGHYFLKRSGNCFLYYLRNMRMMRWISLLMAAGVIAACFFPWVSYAGGNVVEGFYSTNNTWGRPGLFHITLCSIFILLMLIGKLWSMRIGFFVSAINIAWALRNFFLIPACEGGVCPEKHPALYVILFCSLLATITLLFAGARNDRSGLEGMS